jgi:hypothetical protein
MRVETSFRLFGYPGLAILLFLAARGGRHRPRGQHPGKRHPRTAQASEDACRLAASS